jgi:hypothetical protein
VKTNRITEITVETDEVFVIRRPQRSFQAWCSDCSAAVQMVAPEQAAAMSGVSWREIARRVEAGRVHFTEMPAGRLLVCINSLV